LKDKQLSGIKALNEAERERNKKSRPALKAKGLVKVEL
jgi:hypothetical protein